MQKRIVVIGGGTGTFTILSGLKKYPNLDLSVIVSMMDDGGSNRVIRDEFGLLPTSDLRQCMVALASSDSDQTLRKLFTYRYDQGVGISGMTFGNLFMAALTDIYKGDQKKAINETSEILGVKGKIIPITFEKTNLVATYENGKQILGEHAIDEPDSQIGKFRITKLEVIPKIKVNKDALDAINSADLIVLGPGDFYTSILPNLVIDGISSSINKSKAKVVFVTNLMTKFGQTVNFNVSDFINEVEKYLAGRKLDFCILNTSNHFSKKMLSKYKKENAEPVKDDLKRYTGKTKIIRKSLISNKVYEKPKSDKIERSLIRHDSDKLAKVVVDLL
ncbi:MAG: YvcK family protein [Candidatus Woesebacteria bacterium]|nr:YvcK family protein [Candidatus Woesebacteria bacterium]